MADYETRTSAGGTTIIEKNSGGTIVLAVILMLAVLVGGFYLFARAGARHARDKAVAGAAQSVSATAEKLGIEADRGK